MSDYMDLLHKAPYQLAADIQLQLMHFAPHWRFGGGCVNTQIDILNSDSYGEIIGRYDPFIGLHCLQDNHFENTSLFRADSVDKIDRCKSSPIEGSVTGEVSVAVANNTSEVDIHKENERFNSFLESRSQDFIRSLIWMDFEDGVENDVTRQVAEYMKENRFVTYCWLYKIFSNYRPMPIITSSILRTLVMVVNRSDADYMLPVVTAGLSSQHSEDQEAAIMVIEKWRTKSCLEALRNTTYGSDWVKEYALQVVAELKEELCA